MAETISNPPSSTVALSLEDIDESIKSRLRTKPATKATAVASLPAGESVFNHTGLSALYAETLFRFNTSSSAAASEASSAFVAAHGKPASSVGSVALSNWNPAPAQR